MEQYLIDEYDVFEDIKGLRYVDNIEPYFEDCGREYFDCGQGYYQDTADLIVKIGNRFFDVRIEAEVWSDKQDRGDRLYYVNNITSVTYTEIHKPLPKPKTTIVLNITASEFDTKLLINWLNEHKAISWWEMQLNQEPTIYPP